MYKKPTRCHLCVILYKWHVVGFSYPHWITMHGEPHIRFTQLLSVPPPSPPHSPFLSSFGCKQLNYFPGWNCLLWRLSGIKQAEFAANHLPPLSARLKLVGSILTRSLYSILAWIKTARTWQLTYLLLFTNTNLHRVTSKKREGSCLKLCGNVSVTCRKRRDPVFFVYCTQLFNASWEVIQRNRAVKMLQSLKS